MRHFFVILTLLFFNSASGQKKFDSLQVEHSLLMFPKQLTQTNSDTNIIWAIEAIDKKYRTITDTLYSYKSLKYTIFQTVYIETNDSILINPLLLYDRIQTSSIIFNNEYLNVKIDSIAKTLDQNERMKLYSYLSKHFDNFSEKKGFSPQPVRIKYIKFPDDRMVHVGIDIYGEHFLWTIDRKQNWDVIKVDGLWVY